MNWRLKSRIQNACASLPVFQDQAYYLLQRVGGSLRDAPNPMPMLEECASLAKDLAQVGVQVDGKAVMEIGTGRRLDMPIGMYLCGAASIITLDLNALLKEHLVLRSIAAMSGQRTQVVDCFAEIAGRDEVCRRLDILSSSRSLNEVFDKTNIRYQAPADATKPDIPDSSIDVQFSYTVLEHVPRESLVRMLRASHRILKATGVAIHHIDPSDHFAHEDPSISFINFLNFSDEEWESLAGNRFSYHNRLRASDYELVYKEAAHAVLLWKPSIDNRGRKLLENGFPVSGKFQGRPIEDLATVVLRILSHPIREPR